MNKYNYTDKKNKIINIRLTDNEYIFLQNECNRLDMTSSEYIRSVLDTLLIKSFLGGVKYENIKTD